MAHHGKALKSQENKQSKVTPESPIPTKAVNREVQMADVNRGISAGAGKHRGDRRDTSPTYTTNEKHSARGNTPRKDVSTRAR